MIKKIINLIQDEERTVQQRLFVLLAVLSFITMIILDIVGFIIGESTLSKIVMSAGLLVFLGLILYPIRFGHLEILSIFISIFISVVFMPLIFFSGGGIYGGSPLWYIFCTLFISLVIVGKIKYFLLLLNMLSAGVCYYVGYNYPSTVSAHDNTTAYTDSFTSLIAVCIIVCIMVLFDIFALEKEMKKTREQKEEIDALNKAQNRFFSNMSHEIRTPINTIIGLNEMILREDISDEVAEDAENISSASKMLLSLINDILDMSKIESGQMTLSHSVYQFPDLLSEIIGMISVKAREKGLDFRINIDPNLPRALVGDDVRIKQILINVLSNSVKYTSEGYISFSVSIQRNDNKEGVITYTVSDTGIGIKKENIPYLFTAFKRMDEEKNKYIEGTGLGLSIVRQFVDLMGGNITVNSIYTKGSTFIIEIPQKIADTNPIGDLDLEKRGNRDFQARYQQSFEAPDVKILTVDDNPTNLLVVTKLLRDTKMQIDTAESGEEALKKTLENSYNLIFMDHLMPQMDGIECMRLIKNQTGGLSTDSKFIMLTANAGSEKQAFYAKSGADGYLLKPVGGTELEECIIEHLPPELLNIQTVDFAIRTENKSASSNYTKRHNIMITTESVCDLPESILNNRNIKVIPYHVITDKGDFYDGVEVAGRGLADYLREESNNVRPVPPSISEYESFFASCLLNANNVIHIAMSNKISRGFRFASTASEAFENVKVINSENVSSGIGIAVIAAENMLRQGASVEEIVDRISEIKNKITTSFMVNDTDHLVRARIMSPMMSRISKAFFLHPVLYIKNGKAVTSKIILGDQHDVRIKYVNSILQKSDQIDNTVLFLTSVGLTTNEMNELIDIIKKKIEFKNIFIQKASSAIAANCGPGTFGLIYMKK